MRPNLPGCYGFAATYNIKSKTCQSCEFAAGCETEARANLESLRQLLDVDSVIKLMHQQQVVTKSSETAAVDDKLPEVARKLIDRLPSNAQRTAAILLRANINYRKSLEAGVNPIAGRKPVAIAVLFDLLIAGPVSRSAYLQALKEKLSHSPATAASQASIGFAVATGLGIAVMNGDSLEVRRVE